MPLSSMNLTDGLLGSAGRTIWAVVMVSLRASTIFDATMTCSILAISAGEKSFVELTSISAVSRARASVPTALVTVRVADVAAALARVLGLSLPPDMDARARAEVRRGDRHGSAEAIADQGNGFANAA